MAEIYRSTVIEPGTVLQDIRTDVQTKHVPWARPLHGGATKTLFIGPMYSQRETAEIAQRLSMDHQVVFTGNNRLLEQDGQVVGHARRSEVLADLRAKLAKSVDCIIIGNLEWSVLPDDIVKRIFRKVSAGAGLVYVMYNQEFPAQLKKLLTLETANADYTGTVPLGAFLRLQDKNGQMVLEGKPVAGHYRFGAGRIALVHYPRCAFNGMQFLTPDPNDAAAYEYCQSYIIKNVLYASGRQTPLALKSVRVPEQVPLRQLPASVAKVNYSSALNKAQLGEVRLRWIVRNIRNAEIASGQLAGLAKASGAVSLTLPAIPEGIHFLDVSLTLKGAVLDWGSTAFTVVSPDWISDIDMLNDTVEPGAALSGQVVLSRLGIGVGGAMPEDAKLVIKLIDNYGREYGEASLPDKKFVTSLTKFSASQLMWFSLPVGGSLTTINTARAELWQKGRLVSVFEKEFYSPRYPDGDFHVGVWGNAERLSRWSHIAALLTQHEKNVGVDLSMVGHYYNNPQAKLGMTKGLTRSNLSAYPYMERISYFGTDLVRQPSLTDPVFLERHHGELRNWAKELRKLGCVAYSLGDENNLSALGLDVDFSESSQAHFRLWLQKRYASLAELNEVWKSSYKSWEEVKPTVRADAEKAGNLAPWLDHQLHMTDVMMDHMADSGATIGSEDPHARSGPEGIWGTAPYIGIDWQQLADKLQVMFPYKDEALAVASTRSVAPKGALLGTFMGGYPARGLYQPMAAYDPWYALLNSFNSAWFYADYDSAIYAGPYNAFSPDFRFNRMGGYFFDQSDRIRRGIAKVILNSRRGNDGIALYYSQESTYIEGNNSDQMITLLRDAGYQFDVLTTRGLKEGRLKDFRLLIMPNCVSLSSWETEAVRGFARGGGLVLADIVPGIYDEHGRKLAAPQLADLFDAAAVRGAATGSGNTGGVNIPANAAIDTANPLAAPAAPAANGADGSAGAAQEAFGVVNSFGEGRAILLQANLKNYLNDRQLGRNADLAEQMRRLLASAGVAPDVHIVTGTGKNTIQGMDVVRYAFDGGEAVALLRDEMPATDNKPVPLTVYLPAARHVFEYETGRYLGQVKSFAATSRSGAPQLFFALAERPGPLTLTLPASAKAGDTIAVQLAMQNAPFNAVHVTFTAPDGKIAQHYTQNYLLRNGKATIRHGLPLNEARGRWKIDVQDVLTSRKETKTFVVN